MFTDIATCVVPAIVVVVIAIVMVMYQMRQKPSPLSAEEQSIDYQQKEIHGMLGIWSDLKDRFVEAKSDGAPMRCTSGTKM